MWRSVGFLMSFAVVMEGMTLIAFMVMIAGGKQMRESGWKILSGFLMLIGLVQCTGMALIVSNISVQQRLPVHELGEAKVSLARWICEDPSG